MEDNKNEAIEKTFEILSSTVRDFGVPYKIDEKELLVEFRAPSDDLEINIVARVIPELKTIILQSRLPFNISEDKLLDVAIATTMVNGRLKNGSFDFNIAEGKLQFRITSCFDGCEIGGELVRYLIFVSVNTIDYYNDRFFDVIMNRMDPMCIAYED